MKIGLFFGSFNPVHTGHMIIASFMAQHSDLDQVWLVVSPHNPHKPRKTLARDYDRLHLVNLAIGENDSIRACDIEFGMPKPSYTVDTLAFLEDKYPEYTFCLIMGGDNLGTLHKWKNYEQIINRHHIYVYDRPGYENGPFADHPNVETLDAPRLYLSASYIRGELKADRSVQYLVPDAVHEYLQVHNIYKDV